MTIGRRLRRARTTPGAQVGAWRNRATGAGGRACAAARPRPLSARRVLFRPPLPLIHRLEPDPRPHARLPQLRARNTNLARWRGHTQRYRALAVRYGGVLIKLGQFLSIRVDILPPEVTSELRGLQDEVPAETFDDVRAVIEAEFKRPLEEVYGWLSPEPAGRGLARAGAPGPAARRRRSRGKGAATAASSNWWKRTSRRCAWPPTGSSSTARQPPCRP